MFAIFISNLHLLSSFWGGVFDGNEVCSIDFMCRSWSQTARVWIWNGLPTSYLRLGSPEVKPWLRGRFLYKWLIEDVLFREIWRNEGSRLRQGGESRQRRGVKWSLTSAQLHGKCWSKHGTMQSSGPKVSSLGLCISTAPVSHCLQAI